MAVCRRGSFLHLTLLAQLASWLTDRDRLQDGDPFEKGWCDLLFNRQGGLFNTNAYGQCWTTGKYDEPRWRMAGFDRPRPTVRIRSRVSSLLRAGRHLIENNAGSLYVGAVRYRYKQFLLDRAGEIHAGQFKDVTRVAAEMLHYKRKQFQFEDEVRLIWLDKEARRSELFINVKVPGTISQIMTSPHASSVEHRVVRAFARDIGLEVKQSGMLWPTKLPNAN